MIDRYLADVEARLKALRPLIANETLTVERPEGIAVAYLHGRITFLDESQLTIAEILGPSLKTYRFHYMDRQQHLIWRWDSAPHHRRLKTFPFHLHTPEGVIESGPINLLVVLERVRDRVIRQLASP